MGQIPGDHFINQKLELPSAEARRLWARAGGSAAGHGVVGFGAAAAPSEIR